MWFFSKSLIMILISIISTLLMMFMDNKIIVQFNLNSYIEIPMQTTFLIDNQSMIFLSTVSTVSSIILMYSFFYLETETSYSKKKFIMILLLFIMSMFILSLSANMFWIMIGWDGLGISSFCLIIFYQNWKSFSSGMVTFMSNRAGDTLIILSIFMVISSSSPNSWTIPYESWILPMLFGMGAFSKSAQLPYSFWLPQAMAAPTPVSALVHSSTLVTAGIYTLCRFNIILDSFVTTVLFFTSCITVMVAGTSSLTEFDLKKIIALSTLCHISLMMMFSVLKDTPSCLFHLSMHAFFKSLLFMVAGLMIHSSYNSQDIRFISFSMKDLKISFPFFSSVFSMMGFPFMSGYYSKENLLLQSSYIFPSFMMIFMFLINSLFSCAYSIRMSIFIFSNPKMKILNLSKDSFSFILIISSVLSSFTGGIMMPFFIPSEMEMTQPPIMKILLVLFSLLGMTLGIYNFYSYNPINKISIMLSTMWKSNLLYKVFQKHFFLWSSMMMWFIDEKGVNKSTLLNMIKKFNSISSLMFFSLLKEPFSMIKIFHVLFMTFLMMSLL